MKNLAIFLTAFTLTVSPMVANAVDLADTWCVDMRAAHSDYSDNTGECTVFSPAPTPGSGYAGCYTSETYEIEILSHQEESGLFFGRVDVSELPGNANPEYTFFSGVLDGRDIYFTHWDSVTTGVIGKKGTIITFVNQAFDALHRSSKTSIGIATKGDCEEPEE